MSCVVWLYPCTIFLPVFFFFNDTATTEIYTLSLHDALPILGWGATSDEKAMAAYLVMWGLFTAVMFIGTLRLNRALQVVFGTLDRKSTRLNSSHSQISYAVFCLKKKTEPRRCGSIYA